MELTLTETTKSADLSPTLPEKQDEDSAVAVMKPVPERRSLQTLQASSNGNGLNGGRNAYNIKKQLTTDSKDTKTVHSDQNEVLLKLEKPPTHKEQIHTPSRCTVDHTDTPRPVKMPSTSLRVYHDPNPTRTYGTQTDDTKESGKNSDSAFFDQDAIDLMCNDEVSETYWKDLAEERRRALEEALAENCELSQEVATLKRENSRLLEVANEAAQLKEMLEGALSDDEDSAIYTDNQSHITSLTEQEEET